MRITSLKQVTAEHVTVLFEDETDVKSTLGVVTELRLFSGKELDDREMEDDNTTVGGWVIEQIGRYPRVGDRFTYRNLTITVKSKKKLRVMRLLVTVNPDLKEEEEDDDLLSL